MHTDFKDSLKARLYDFKYTPFLASYTFFWIFFNAKLLLIFVNDKLTVQSKIEMMAYSDINITNPFYGALLYTLVFPLFTALFYFFTLQYKRLMNYIKQQIEDVTPLTQKEINEIKKVNADLRLELDKKIDELNKAKKRFENKEQNLSENYDAQFKDDKEELQEEIQALQEKLIDSEGEPFDELID